MEIPPLPDPQLAVSRIFGLYQTHGVADYSGEPVSQPEHGWQAAALAEAEGYDDEVLLAAFFPDLGHPCAPGAASMAGFGAEEDHEQLRANCLRARGFSARLAEPVADTGATAFEQNPDAAIILRLRQWDDQAKAAHRPAGNLEHLKYLALRHLLRQ